ncbi:MAG: beta-lactamase family protein [Proteobacteria bacterium]|nr:beta-lactamase family protein [Pseudomonadota bacterium]
MASRAPAIPPGRKNSEVVKLAGYGFANLEHEVPVTPDTVFELASVTKQFTAAAILRLVEMNLVALDAPITTYLADAPEAWRAITVRHLLTHTSGLPNLENGFKAAWQDGGAPRLFYSTADLYRAAALDSLNFAPGTRFQYSDVGYFLLGMVIEKVSGKRYAPFLAAHFFRPLDMKATSVPSQWTIVKNRAAGYTIRNGELVNIRRHVQIELASHFGVFSTVKDLVTWDAALAAGQLLKPAALAELWTPVRLNDSSRYPYGFGWVVDERRNHRMISHTGITGTEYARYPDDGVTVIVLTNLGRRLGPSTVNSWGLTHGVAGRYIPGLLVGPQPAEPDPDPALSQRLRQTLDAIARNEDAPLLNPRLAPYFTPEGRAIVAERLASVASFSFVACDPVPTHATERFGMMVGRVCHYRLVNAKETRYYTFWLSADARIADVWSTTE